MTCERLPSRRGHEVISFEHDGQQHVAGAGRFADGVLGEVFLSASKSGTAIETFAADGATCLVLPFNTGLTW
jgi:hypothetical protein